MTQPTSPSPKKKRRRTANISRAKRFTRLNRAGPPGHAEAVKEAQAAEARAIRRAKAWRLLTVDRLTFAQIGAKLGVSNYTAHQDCVAYRDMLGRTGLHDAQVIVERIQAGIDGVVAKHWTKRDRVESGRVILQALDSEMKLHGVAKQRTGTYTADQVLAAVRGIIAELMSAFTSREHRILITRAFRRQLGDGAEESIDVTPKGPSDEDPNDGEGGAGSAPIA